MNMWRSNQSKIIKIHQSNPVSSSHRESVLTLPISIHFNNFPPSFFLTYPGKLFKQSNKIIHSNDVKYINNTNSVDPISTLPRNQQCLDFIPNFTHYFTHLRIIPLLIVSPQRTMLQSKTRPIRNLRSLLNFH